MQTYPLYQKSCCSTLCSLPYIEAKVGGCLEATVGTACPTFWLEAQFVPPTWASCHTLATNIGPCHRLCPSHSKFLLCPPLQLIQEPVTGFVPVFSSSCCAPPLQLVFACVRHGRGGEQNSHGTSRPCKDAAASARWRVATHSASGVQAHGQRRCCPSHHNY